MRAATLTDGARGIECGNIIGEGWIAEVFALSQQVHRIGRVGLKADGRGADAAVADNDGRDALRDLGQHRRRLDDAGVVVRVNVDEAGCKAQAVGLDDLRGIATKGRTDFKNAAIVNSDIKQLQRRFRCRRAPLRCV